MESKVNVVIIGASYAGITTAHGLLRGLPCATVTLINPSRTFYFNVAAPRLLAKPDAFQRDQYLLPIHDQFDRYAPEAYEFVQGHATAIDAAAKTVTVDDRRTVAFDYLVIASGSTTQSTIAETGIPVPFKHPGTDDLPRLIESAQQALARASRIVIGGAGPIGVELAGELAEAAHQSGPDLHITIVSATFRVLPQLKQSGSDAAERLLAAKKVEVIKSTRVIAAEKAPSSSQWTVALSNGGQLKADMYIPTTGVLPNNTFIPPEYLDQDGWVNVDQELRVQGRSPTGDRAEPLPIYAAGDITNNSMRLSFKATEQAQVVVANLKAEVTGRGKRRTYSQGDGVNMLVPVGASGGTGQIFGWTPWSAIVKALKGKDFFVSKAQSMISAK